MRKLRATCCLYIILFTLYIYSVRADWVCFSRGSWENWIQWLQKMIELMWGNQAFNPNWEQSAVLNTFSLLFSGLFTTLEENMRKWFSVYLKRHCMLLLGMANTCRSWWMWFVTCLSVGKVQTFCCILHFLGYLYFD